MSDHSNREHSKVEILERQSKTWQDQQIKGLVLAIALLVSVVSFGCIGYSVIEGWGLHDALYMTVITLSTVGYGEVQPLSPNGQVFSMVLILMGMCTVAYAFGKIGRSMIEGELYQFRGFYAMQKRIQSLEDHTIILLCR